MNINIITLFPDMFQALKYGVVGRAIENDLLTLHFSNPRQFTNDTYSTVDDRPYGGGPGMVMKVAPIRKAIYAAKELFGKEAPVFYLSPQGKVLTQSNIISFLSMKNLILLAGRYEGIDQRLIDQDVNECWSIGNYVVSGGELPIMVLIDAICRLLPGSLGNDQSAQQDSFFNGLLDHPHYTRPSKVDGQEVPAILLSGDHKAILRWRKQQALKNTWQMRPDLLKIANLSKEEKRLLDELISEPIIV